MNEIYKKFKDVPDHEKIDVLKALVEAYLNVYEQEEFADYLAEHYLSNESIVYYASKVDNVLFKLSNYGEFDSNTMCIIKTDTLVQQLILEKIKSLLHQGKEKELLTLITAR